MYIKYLDKRKIYILVKHSLLYTKVIQMENKSKIEITKLTNKKMVTMETEHRNNRIYMRAKVRKLGGGF